MLFGLHFKWNTLYITKYRLSTAMGELSWRSEGATRNPAQNQMHKNGKAKKKKSQNCPCNRPRRPTELRDVDDLKFFTQLAQRWWWGCQPYASAALYPQERLVNPKATVRLKGLGQLKNAITSSWQEMKIKKHVRQDIYSDFHNIFTLQWCFLLR
jgi:hypothetical protein